MGYPEFIILLTNLSESEIQNVVGLLFCCLFLMKIMVESPQFWLVFQIRNLTIWSLTLPLHSFQTCDHFCLVRMVNPQTVAWVLLQGIACALGLF